MKTVEQTKTDLQMSKSTHSEEVQRYLQDRDLLREELEATQSQLTEADAHNADLKSSVEGTNEEVERLRQAQSEATMMVSCSGIRWTPTVNGAVI